MGPGSVHDPWWIQFLTNKNNGDDNVNNCNNNKTLEFNEQYATWQLLSLHTLKP